MIRLKNGTLYQWDIGRVVEIDDSARTVTQVQFAKIDETEALLVPFERKGTKIECRIPNILLQSEEKIIVYVMSDTAGETKTVVCRSFCIVKRPKPTGYVYTESEVLTYRTLEEKLEQAKESLKVTPEQIEAVVTLYLEENPVTVPPVSSDAVEAALGYRPMGNSGSAFGQDDVKYYTPSSAGSVAIQNGSKASNGAGIWLYGNSNSGAGKFRLQVYDESTSTYRAFDGQPNGDLKWSGGFLNPPMVAGTEYLTAERYEGKAVYKKLINIGSLPNKGTKTVATGINGKNAFDMNFDIHMSSGQYTHFPYVSTSFAAISRAYLEQGGNLVIETNADMSSYTAKVTVKYTKS